MSSAPAEAFTGSPFGATITADEVIDTLGFFDDWEDRYRYVIDLGKQLVPVPDSERTDEALIQGCQSQVWIAHRRTDGKEYFLLDPDAHIVRGLAAIVLAAFNGQSAASVAAFDVDSYFEKLDLISHLSPTRGNGLRAMVLRIKALAAA